MFFAEIMESYSYLNMLSIQTTAFCDTFYTVKFQGHVEYVTVVKNSRLTGLTVKTTVITDSIWNCSFLGLHTGSNVNIATKLFIAYTK